MPLINFAKREITYKLVYYGTGLGGKTTNLKYIHGQVNQACRGEMISLATETERTLFFDFMPLELDLVNGFRARIAIYTVPGQEEYDLSRKQILRGCDGIIFVADSSSVRQDANIESLKNMRENLIFNKLKLEEIPWILQYNKRDLADAVPLEKLEQNLNQARVPYFEACALEGLGVFATLKAVIKEMVNRTKAPK
ncbi:MAG: GTPase domain-containing protein [Cyanobacteriota/Melainabacteria group bacterium]|nr:GTPase domain-containing protein [Cyanobacteria bacterium HKST-UBA01]MCB9468811.1 GTPase domain-containing protein [Candidatus Obscuribacterales bacterium]